MFNWFKTKPDYNEADQILRDILIELKKQSQDLSDLSRCVNKTANYGIKIHGNAYD